MFRIQTQLSHFRFNSIHQHGPFRVTWYKLVGENEDSGGTCLTQIERDELINYFANNHTNFNGQNYHICELDDAPSCEIYDLISSERKMPNIVIVRKKPKRLNKKEDIYNCMDIELLQKNGSPNHTYKLSFDIIGEIHL